MNAEHFTSGTGEPSVTITRLGQTQWHALADGREVGRGDALTRPDGRIFLGIDSWHDTVFDQLADAMLAGLPRPLHTVVDEADADLISHWARAGFATRRREWEYLVPTDPRTTGLDAATLPAGVTILAAGTARAAALRALDRAIRDEVEATVGWQDMPAEVLPRPDGQTVMDPSKYAVAALSDHYVGLVRVVQVTRQPRIGLIAVRAGRHRRGIARALLAHALDALHHRGIDTASTEVNESNIAATALFEGVGARRVSSNLELVLR